MTTMETPFADESLKTGVKATHEILASGPLV